MADYIRRDDAMFALRKAERGGSMTALTRLERAYAEIREMPAADVAEVGHARWERVRSNWYCTGCNKGYRITKGAPMASGFSYCPNCGAKMDGAAE
jgi:rubredoxin|nr:MAG TPA: hydrogenase/urease nickel incorporation protein [Caudoviricetes sp.]